MSATQSYGAVSIEQDNDEKQPLNGNKSLEVKDRPALFGKSWAWIVGIGALVTLTILLSISASRSRVPLKGSSDSSLPPPENQQLFYNEQLVDHFDKQNKATWSNRYYKSTKYFQGSGHPIFIIVGGEGALDHGMLYPFVTEVLAKKFGAAVLECEHRFYGPYWPIQNATSHQLLKLLTPSQAMADMVQLTKHIRDTEFIDCSPDRNSPKYCPIITVGASYPGFLSFLFRIVHGDFVDIAYASSAPLLMYAQISDPNSYYDIVSRANDRVSPGCSHAVRVTIEDMYDRVDAAPTLKDAAKSIGVCPHNLPRYIETKHDLADAIKDTVKVSFAGYNSENYPPGPSTSNYKACKAFQNTKLNTKDTLSLFFRIMLLQETMFSENCYMSTVECNYTVDDFDERCFDYGEYEGGTGDDDEEEEAWSDAMSWEFQTCTNVIFLAGLSNTSFLPPHPSTYKELTERCQDDFGVKPRPTEMVETWDYVNKLNTSSHILFVNGVQDMWASGSIMTNISDTVIAINIENGAHHSDLTHEGPTDQDTEDVKEAFVEIENILTTWLDEIQHKSSRS